VLKALLKCVYKVLALDTADYISLVRFIPNLGCIELILFKELRNSSRFFLTLLVSALNVKSTFNYLDISRLLSHLFKIKKWVEIIKIFPPQLFPIKFKILNNKSNLISPIDLKYLLIIPYFLDQIIFPKSQ
jgi:hypothetical protein